MNDASVTLHTEIALLHDHWLSNAENVYYTSWFIRSTARFYSLLMVRSNAIMAPILRFWMFFRCFIMLRWDRSWHFADGSGCMLGTCDGSCEPFCKTWFTLFAIWSTSREWTNYLAYTCIWNSWPTHCSLWMEELSGLYLHRAELPHTLNGGTIWLTFASNTAVPHVAAREWKSYLAYTCIENSFPTHFSSWMEELSGLFLHRK